MTTLPHIISARVHACAHPARRVQLVTRYRLARCADCGAWVTPQGIAADGALTWRTVEIGDCCAACARQALQLPLEFAAATSQMR